MDIFSQALASADLGELSSENNSKKRNLTQSNHATFHCVNSAVEIGSDVEKESEPLLVPPKAATNSNAANVRF